MSFTTNTCPFWILKPLTPILKWPVLTYLIPIGVYPVGIAYVVGEIFAPEFADTFVAGYEPFICTNIFVKESVRVY